MERTKAALRRLSDRFDIRIRYAGPQEKSRFAAALAAESAVPRRIVDFALFGDERCACRPARTATVCSWTPPARSMLAVDDDTLCRIAAAPERESALSFFSGLRPHRVLVLSGSWPRHSICLVVDVDVLGCHERCSGAPSPTWAVLPRRAAA